MEHDPVGGAGHPDVIRELKARLEGLEQLQDTMRRVNDYYRKNNTLDGCPHMSADQIATVKAAMDSARGWRAEVKPFDSYAMISNNAAIHQLKDRIDALSHPQERMTAIVPDDTGQSGQVCTEERLATEFYEVAWLCTPAQSEDSAARAAQISGLTQLLRQEGRRAANQMLLAVSDFVTGTEVSKDVQKRADTLMTEFARYQSPSRGKPARRKSRGR
ncbi:MAG: hypothetical protein HDT33_11510 [Clostridiales bacterium]|nr:hypothetical protein [Clostridiales bacterium]